MKLTCVTAVFNAIKSGNRENLIRCVKSVAALKTEHEHLVYDGASTDGTAELLWELEAKTSGLRVVSEKDGGVYFALNKGVRDARGEWFYVLGCDDYVKCPDRMDALLDTDGSFDMFVTTVERENGDLYFTNMQNLKWLALFNCYSHQGVVMRTRFVRVFGGFDENNRISADYDMFWKAHKAGLRIRYSFEPFAVYSRGGLSSDFANNEKYDAELLARHLGATPDQIAARRMRSLPISVIMRLYRYHDAAIRICAHFMLKMRLVFLVRMLFCPIVVLTRPLRHRK